MQFLIAYISSAIFFLVIDYVWLGIIMKDFFREQLGHLMTDNVNLSIAALFYLFYAAGVVLLCILPALESRSWVKAVALGAVLGFLAYGTYDITNMATLKDWPVMMSVIDITWGTALTAATAAAGYFITTTFYSGS